MLTFRTSITFAVMAFIVALTALLIAIQLRLVALCHRGSRFCLHGCNQHQGARAASRRTFHDFVPGPCARHQFERRRLE